MRHHNLYIFAKIVSESLAWCSMKKVFLFVKFTGTWGIELVSLNKNHKIPENTSFSGTYSKPSQTSKWLFNALMHTY